MFERRNRPSGRGQWPPALDVEIDGQKFLAKAGSAVYVPANMEHSMVATPEEDVIFIAIKDLSHGIIGKATDGTMDGPKFMPGFEPI